MHKLALVVFVAGCWRDSQPAKSTPVAVAAAPTPATPAAKPYGGAAYGGILGGTQIGEFVSLTGTGDISSGFDDTNTHSGPLGQGSGVGISGMRGAHAAVPTVSIGQPTATAGLDKAIIRRYIKRNIQKIQYCYEKELQQTPGIAGKVTVQFRIEPTGKVSNSTGNGLAVVDACVADVILAIEFPQPQGGAVDVTYPFLFHATVP